MVEINTTKCNKGTENQETCKREDAQGTCSKAGQSMLKTLVPANLLPPGPAQQVLHPNKDVFVLKVAKVSATGDRRCKMELELVTPKGPDTRLPARIDTRETQCDPEPPCQCCMKHKRKRK